MATIITKNSSTASSVPTAAQLLQGELAVNVTDKRLFTENASGTVVELGTNPSSLALPNGSANGVAYLNGSKVLTTGSALTYNGTTLTADTSSTSAANLRIENGSFNRVGAFQLTANGVQFDAFDQNSTSAQRSFMWLSGGSEQMRLTSTGLGIGTSSPLVAAANRGNVTINGSTDAILSFGSAGANTGYLYATTSGLELASIGSTFVRFSTNNTERARIDSSGWFRFTQGPSTFYIGNAGDIITSGTAGASALRSENALCFATGGATERARIDSSGNLLVGTTSQIGGATGRISMVLASGQTDGIQYKPGSNITYYPGVFFNSSNTVVGSISSTSTATSYATSSDYRLKENIAPMTGALAKVAALKPVTYKWKADGSDGEGFIAHELAEVCPQAVTGEKDAVDADGNPKYQGIDTSFLVATLTAAIQELKAEFDAYKAAHP